MQTFCVHKESLVKYAGNDFGKKTCSSQAIEECIKVPNETVPQKQDIFCQFCGIWPIYGSNRSLLSVHNRPHTESGFHPKNSQWDRESAGCPQLFKLFPIRKAWPRITVVRNTTSSDYRLTVVLLNHTRTQWLPCRVRQTQREAWQCVYNKSIYMHTYVPYIEYPI